LGQRGGEWIKGSPQGGPAPGPGGTLSSRPGILRSVGRLTIDRLSGPAWVTPSPHSAHRRYALLNVWSPNAPTGHPPGKVPHPSGFGMPARGQRRARCRWVGVMNPVERAGRWVDARQQRYAPLAFVIGVVKKYGDDNGGVLVANLAYSCFISLFPLLLVLVTIVGLVAASDPAFRTAVHNAVASQLPLIGQQLTGNVHQLRRSSVIGLIAGLAAAVLGAAGPAQAGVGAVGAV